LRGPQRIERESPDLDNLRQALGNNMQQAEMRNRSGKLTPQNAGVKPALLAGRKKEFFFSKTKLGSC